MTAPDAALEGEAPGIAVPTLVTYGDEIVVRFLSSGKTLVALAAPVFSATRGQLIVHRLDADTRENSGSVEAFDVIKTAAHADALIGQRQLWTPQVGFAYVPNPVALSDDGRFVASINPSYTDLNSLVIDVFSSAAASKENGTFNGLPTLGGLPSRSISPVTIKPFVVFSADGATVFVANQNEGPFRVTRADTRGARVAQYDVGTTDGLDPVPFLTNAAGDLAFRDAGGIYAWRRSEPAPVPLAKPGDALGPFGPLVGLSADFVYFVAGTDPAAATATNRLSLGTGHAEPFVQTTAVALKAVSPDGRYAVVRAVAPFGRVALVELAAAREIVTLGTCSDFDRGAFVFTADSRHAVGARFACDSAGVLRADVSPDVISVDVETGSIRTLAERSFGDQLFVTDTNRVVFVKPYYPDLVPLGDPIMSKGDLLMIGVEGGTVTQIVAGVDGAIAGHGHLLAYSVHGPSDRAGVYTIDVP